MVPARKSQWKQPESGKDDGRSRHFGNNGFPGHAALAIGLSLKYVAATRLQSGNILFPSIFKHLTFLSNCPIAIGQLVAAILHHALGWCSFVPFISSNQIKCELLCSNLRLVLSFWPELRNSTLLSTPPDTYWGQFEEISKYNTHLSVVERLWTAWYAWMQNDVLATGIMSFMMHEIVYFGRSLPWIFIDSLVLLKNYKIQSVSALAL